ncbi:hypothetical protein ACFX2J_017821 [Malus domestica]
MKCVGIQYLEAIRRLKASGFKPKRSVYLSYGPDEEIGGHDGAEKLAESNVFKGLNVGIMLDEVAEFYKFFFSSCMPKDSSAFELFHTFKSKFKAMGTLSGYLLVFVFHWLKRYKGFKEGQNRILVATDLVGRGIDIERVNIVINYDMPDSADTYNSYIQYLYFI